MTAPDDWAEIEAAWEGRPTSPSPVRRGPIRSGALVAAVLLGLADAIEPVRRQQVLVEVDVDAAERVPGRVYVWLDPGSPTRSMAVVPLT